MNKPKPKPKLKAKKCEIGNSCGLSCISQSKECEVDFDAKPDLVAFGTLTGPRVRERATCMSTRCQIKEPWLLRRKI